VPDAESPSRSPRRGSGLTIHRLGAGGYEPVPASIAFPGWTAAEIHTALNEATLSEATSAVLTRIGRALGDAGGTVPDDDPWLREQRREATLQAVMQVFRARGIAVPERLAARLADAPSSDLIDAALACRDEADFLARLKQ
jgi:2C-methyl-D-erythritol 2,4-cyclodiphosphate synthase